MQFFLILKKIKWNWVLKMGFFYYFCRWLCCQKWQLGGCIHKIWVPHFFYYYPQQFLSNFCRFNSDGSKHPLYRDSLLRQIVVRFVPLVINHNLSNRMLGQARPNFITQVIIYNLGYALKPRVGNKLLCAI